MSDSIVGRRPRRLISLSIAMALLTTMPLAAAGADPAGADPAGPAGRDPGRLAQILAKMRPSDHPHPDGADHDHGPGGMAALDPSDLAYLGLRKGTGPCSGAFESSAAAPGSACTHGLDLPVPDDPAALAAACVYFEDCPPPAGWSRTNPPTSIPCYSTGPFVQVLYLYWGTGDFTNSKERIRRSVASVDLLIKISAAAVKNGSGVAGNRHVRWAMDSSCKLKITAVKMPSTVSDGLFDIKDDLTRRGIITNASKYLAYVDNDVCAGGIAEMNVDSRKVSTNQSNNGGSLAMVYDCFGEFDPYAGYGATIAAHESMHTLGAVQFDSPYTTEGHCWDDIAAPHEGADIMCYDDYRVAPDQFFERCPPTYPETFDCGKDDYYNPFPPSGTYLAGRWNSADNRFLSGSEPTAWDTVAKPAVTFSKPAASGGTIGGTTIAEIGSGGIPGIPITEVAWTIDGAAVFSESGTPTTLRKSTFKTRAGGYANGTSLTIKASVKDAGGLGASGSTKATVWNPYVRIVAPGAFAETSGITPWSVAATAFGGRTVAKVDFLVDGVVRATDTSAPFGGTYTAPAFTPYGPGDTGPYTVAARVTDSAGVMRQSPTRTLYHPHLGVAWRGPSMVASGYWTDSPLRVPAGATVPMAATAWASASAGIHRVLFKVNGVTVATDYTAPYTYDHVTSSTVGDAIEVTARAVDANGAYVTTPSLFIESVARIGSQSASITPASADVGGDIAFRMVTTPPSGGTVDQACLYVDSGYGDGCIYPSSSSEDTLTLPASTFGVGPHIASWHLYGTTSSGDPYYLDTGLARFTVTGSSGVPAIAITTLANGGRYKGRQTVGVTVTGLPSSVTVQQVDFFEGGRALGSDYFGPPYSAIWNTAVGPDGSRTISAEATLSDGAVLRAAVTAAAANASASLTAPAAGATVSGVRTLSGVGTYDADTALESGAFLIDGVVIATDRVAPFSYGWNTASVANGTHTVAMRLRLSDGRTLTTPPVSVTVAN